MTDTKYFAYYIPSNKPTLMNNIVELMIKEYGQANHKHEYNRVDANINCNDWEETIDGGMWISDATTSTISKQSPYFS